MELLVWSATLSCSLDRPRRWYWKALAIRYAAIFCPAGRREPIASHQTSCLVAPGASPCVNLWVVVFIATRTHTSIQSECSYSLQVPSWHMALWDQESVVVAHGTLGSGKCRRGTRHFGVSKSCRAGTHRAHKKRPGPQTGRRDVLPLTCSGPLSVGPSKLYKSSCSLEPLR